VTASNNHISNSSGELYNLLFEKETRNAGKTLCIFAAASYTGKLDDYVVYYLEQLQKAEIDIIFITRDDLRQEDIIKLSGFCIKIIRKPNVGLDFYSWKIALSVVDNLTEYEALALANDSVFGPFFDLKEIINAMTQKNVDFWGLTNSYETGYHLQSYFLYFSRSVFTSAAFTAFWENVTSTNDKQFIVVNYEIGFTQLLLENNFTHSAYSNIDEVNLENPDLSCINPNSYYWKEMIGRQRFPFLKRELLIDLRIQHFDAIRSCIEIILQSGSSYPVHLITNYFYYYFKDTLIKNYQELLYAQDEIARLSRELDLKNDRLSEIEGSKSWKSVKRYYKLKSIFTKNPKLKQHRKIDDK
jgi:lipopolysaccharide biosynthesis protein